jgi:hypothetical protein
MVDMSESTENIITEIIRILQIDGDLATDGECLDMVAGVLEENGYFVYDKTPYRTGDLGSYGKPDPQ